MDLPAVLHDLPLQSVAALVAGIVVLLAPPLLNYAVASYLLVIGALGLLQVYTGQALRPHTGAALVAGVLILLRPNVLNYVVGIYPILIGLLDSGINRFQV